MPRHDYKCPNCGLTVEFNLPLGVTLTADCPTCKVEMVKQWAAPSFTIKGFNAKNGYAS